MNATAQQTEPDSHEMMVIHRIFRPGSPGSRPPGR
jgi:hypothetical protein